MTKLIKILALTGALAFAGCSPSNQNQSVNYNTPKISSKGKESFEMLDRTTLQNLPGFKFDFDGDGIADFLTMRNNTLYFSKGNADGNFGREIPIAEVTSPVIAYSIRTSPDQPRPYFVFFDDRDKGYMQRNLGNNEQGIPFLGDVEELSDKAK